MLFYNEKKVLKKTFKAVNVVLQSVKVMTKTSAEEKYIFTQA